MGTEPGRCRSNARVAAGTVINDWRRRGAGKILHRCALEMGRRDGSPHAVDGSSLDPLVPIVSVSNFV